MDSRSFVELKPTWNTHGPYDIHVCLNCGFENEENGSQEEEESCNSPQSVVVVLSTSDQSSPEPCMLRIQCKPGAELVAMAILSNARHAEFVSLADENLLHLHHIHLTLRRSSKMPLVQGRHGNVNMDHVRGLLASQQPISEEAESLMNTIEQYQKNQSSVVQDFQAAVVESAANQKSASSDLGSDLGMMGQMASLLSGFSRSGNRGQVAASPNVMLKMMSSFGGGGGDSPGKESMYGALKMMCTDVTNMRSQEEQDAKNKAKQDQENSNNEEEKTNEPGVSQNSLEKHLESFLANMEAKMMSRLDAKLDTLQAHFDLRLNKLENMLTKLTTQTVQKSASSDLGSDLASDLGMMGQMASLLSGFSRSGNQGQVAEANVNGHED